MAVVKGRKGKRPDNHLLQEPQGGARLPSTLCCAPSAASLGGLVDWVGSFNSPSPSLEEEEEHESDIVPAFTRCFSVFGFYVHVTTGGQ